MKIKIFKNKKNVPGFSLIEMLLVIFIVAVGLVGVSQLVVQSLQSQHISERTVVAYQLAQEGIELVRYIRDTNWLTPGNSWNDGLEPGDYCIDYINPVLRPTTEECYMYLDDENWYYSPVIIDSGSNDNQYRRTINISSSMHTNIYNTYASSSISVVSIVSWYEGDRLMHYKTEADLFDWK